jgi:hypothetical protein
LDPVTDALYTINFAALGLREAVAATGNATMIVREKMLAQYLVRIQQVSEEEDGISELDGAWMRAFDFEKWEVWGSAADIGWGPWCVETGWMNTWCVSEWAPGVASTLNLLENLYNCSLPLFQPPGS